ncbi:CinA family protein [Algoriphagus sp.]|uniref:CinA family protein n=1 Tax=Algoriphagus sp. TaxID=1872435 RepID=UPI003F723E16
MNLFGGDKTQDALNVIREYCLNHSFRISVAESVTAGLMQLMLSTCENAGMFFCGGITTYNCIQKRKQLYIQDNNCIALDGVSRQIAENMARQVSRKFSSELSLSITGFAAPIPEKGITELFAYGSFCLNGEIVLTEKLTTSQSNQLDAQQEYASSLVQLCADSILSKFGVK